ncbi:hypothetical protein JCM8547_001436 [Rhodosporidiobolus lusitaniae]
MLAKLRARPSFLALKRRLSSSRSPASPTPPPLPIFPPANPEDYLAAAALQAQYDDEAAALALAEQLQLEILEEELRNEELAREMEEAERRRERLEREANEAELQRIEEEEEEQRLRRENGVFECPICADEFFRGEPLVVCTEGHLLCTSCAREGSKAAFSNLDPSLSCLAEGDCIGRYSEDETLKFLDTAQLGLLAKIRMEKDLSAIGEEGLLQCPICPYAAVFEDHATLEILDCLNPDCARRTCLKCKHPAHPNVPCALANPNPVHKLEEEMSAALIRQCGKCKRPFVKQDGCNLITCVGCSAKSCYLCRALLVDGYDHFKQAGPCKNLLFDDKEVLRNVEAVRQAGIGTLQTAEERAHAKRLKIKVK